MIRLILGQPGSGKTLSAVKWLMDNGEESFTNFNVRRKGITRIKISDIIKTADDGKQSVNWDFWKDVIEQKGGFHICIDELHNIMHSRTSMTKKNILMSQWVAQIRKVTGENEKYDFVCISQELERVDVAVRDLTYQIIACIKHVQPSNVETRVYERGKSVKKILDRVWVIRYYFTGAGCVERYRMWRDVRRKTYNYKTFFPANEYMKYYDSYELVNFGEGEYL